MGKSEAAKSTTVKIPSAIKSSATPTPQRLNVPSLDTPSFNRSRNRSGSAPPNPNRSPTINENSQTKSLSSAKGSNQEPGDGFAKSSPKPGPGLQSTQKQVDEVVDIMRTNIDKILERDAKLQDLDSRCQTLHDTSATFQSTTKKVCKKFWWKDKLYLLIISSLLLLVVVSIAIGLIIHFA